MAESKLSLDVRKNIRDEWDNKKDTIKEKMKTSTGVDWEIEIDWNAVHTAIDEKNSFKGRPGYAAFSTINGFVSNTAKQLEDPLVKGAFLEAVPKRTIVYGVQPKLVQSGYCDVVFTDGMLGLHSKNDKMCTNIQDIGQNLISLIPTVGKLTWVQKKNIRDDWEKKRENIEKGLKDATGVDWKFELNWEKILEPIPENNQYKKRPGYFVYESINGLLTHITKKCKDNMVKEALLEGVPKKTITYKVLPQKEVKGSIFDLKIEDGMLAICVKDDRVCTNVGQIGENLEKIL